MVTTRFGTQSIIWPPQGSSFRSISIQSALSGAQTDTDLWLPSDGRKIVIMGFHISKETAGQVDFKDEDGVALFTAQLAAGENLPIDSGVEPFWVGKKSKKITLTTTGANGIFISIWGHEDDSQ